MLNRYFAILFLPISLLIYSKDQDLEKALLNNDIELVKSLINNSANLEKLGKYNKIPLLDLFENQQAEDIIYNKFNELAQKDNKNLLFWAIEKGLYNLVELLNIVREFDLTTVNQNTGFTVIHQAINYNQERILRYLLIRTGVSLLNIQDVQNRTALQLAQDLSRSNLINIINDKINNHGKIIDRPGSDHNDRMTKELHEASRKCDSVAIARLLINGAFINARDEEGKTALHKITERRLPPLKLLLDNGADINAKDKSGKTPFLSGIAKGGMLDFLNDMVEYGADITVSDNNGTNALHFAANNGDLNLVDFLLSKPEFNINMVDNNGQAAIDYAAEIGDLGLVKCLIYRGAILDANAKDNKKMDIFFWAIRKGYFHIVKKLVIFRKCQVNEIYDIAQKSALQEASENGQYKIAKYLINNGASVNYRDAFSNLAIHYAVIKKNNTSLVRLLVENGAKFNEKDGCGKTPLDLARDNNLTSTIKYLESLINTKK